MKLKIGFASILLAVTSLPSIAASTTHTISASATVTGNCRFQTAGPTALTMGNGGGAIDPSLTADATGSAAVLFRCTTGTTSAVAADDGLNFASGSRNVKDGGTNVMPYALALSGDAQAGTGHGAGQDKTLTVSGTITAANYQNAPAGTYTDTVVLTITP